LIGPGTVNTVPTETWQAFRSQGRVRATLTENQTAGLEQAERDIKTLGEVCIPIEAATDQLLQEGVQKFSDAFDKLLSAIEKKRQTLLGGGLAKQSYALADGQDAVQDALNEWRAAGKVRRFWNADTTLWTRADEDRWLGWLHVVEGQRDHLDQLQHVVDDVKAAGFRHALLLGMGGSSLCAEVMKRTFGALKGSPELFVLDSTVPAQVEAFARQIDLAQTLFIVSSKSGGTTEPNAFKQFFFDRVSQNGSQFIAITDPGTALHKLAKADRFRHIVHGIPSIGGRYSAMSNFGLVPAGIMGMDVSEFLARAEIMVQSCAAFVPPEVNLGVTLGILMGTLAGQARDKLTIVASPAISALGAWLEQLIAESTGKHGKGIVPVDGERVAPPEAYGNDRVFVYLRLETAAVRDQDDAVDALERAGHPVIRIKVEDRMDLGQEFFRWEIATAVAGSVLGINPFDQPDVEASKVATRNLTAAYEQSGELPKERPLLQEAGLGLYTDAANAEAIGAAASARSLTGYLKAHLQRLQANDYFAINAYVEMSPENDQPLQALRHAVRDRWRVATTLGYGPRFLHSTGQLHKGGPNNGVFLQITADDAEDLGIPGQNYSFGILKRFQAQGDFEVLAERTRRALRVHLGPDVAAGLKQLQEIITSD
jgi:transaldolase/glucose-6-phosphate isomerase